MLASNPVGLNPYLLGIKTFLNIEKRYNAGQFGPEWERSENVDKWRIDNKVGKGMEKIFEVRRTHMDWFFLDEFLNGQVAEESRALHLRLQAAGQYGGVLRGGDRLAGHQGPGGALLRP